MNEATQRYLQNIQRASAYPLLRGRERYYAGRIAKGDKQAISIFGESYALLAAELAQEYYSKEAWRGVLLSELIHQANIGLFIAVKRYPSSVEQPFTEFATRYVLIYLNQMIDDYRLRAKHGL